MYQTKKTSVKIVQRGGTAVFATSGHLKFRDTDFSLLIVKSIIAPHTFESGLVV